MFLHLIIAVWIILGAVAPVAAEEKGNVFGREAQSSRESRSSESRSCRGSCDGNARIDVCYFPPGNPTNFFTRTVSGNARRGYSRLAGSCEANCLEICYTDSFPVFPFLDDYEETEKCVERCLPGEADTIGLVLTSHTGDDYRVEACDTDSVLVAGSRARVGIFPGMMLVYTHDDDDGDSCDIGCSPLFRRVESVTENPGGTVFLSTSFVTFGEILGSGFVDPSLESVEIEPLSACLHSSTDLRYEEKGSCWGGSRLAQLPLQCELSKQLALKGCRRRM